LPVLLLAILSAWHLYSYFTTIAVGAPLLHLGTIIVAILMTLASLFLRNTDKEISRYMESLVEPIRPQLIGMVCFILAGLHFITIPAEPIFLKMAYLVVVLAFFETAGMANRFLPAISGDVAQVTKDTLKRLLLNQVGMLAMVFALSVVLLYMSLMVVVGFSETWTVALLAAIMILSLAFMTMVRRL